MTTDYKDLLIQLLLEKVEAKQVPITVTASSVVTPIKKKTKRKYYGYHKWTPEEFITVAEYFKAGFTAAEMSSVMGIKASAIEMAIYNMRHGRGNVPPHLVGVYGRSKVESK